MFDTYYGRIYGAGSTGNCSRGGAFGVSLPYEASPRTATKYIEVLPGKKKLEDMIESTDGQAVLIVDMPIGIFFSNVSTGEFSAVANSALLVENGEKKHSLQPVSVSGNFYKGLEKLLDIGKDVERTPFMAEVPSMIFDGFSIVG